MAVSTTVKVRRDGTITLTDGSGSPVTLTVDYEDGNFTADRLAASSDRVVIRDRGSIVGLREGDEQVGSLSFSVHFREFTNATGATLLDFVNGTAAGVSLTSTGGTGFDYFLCTVAMTTEGTTADGADGVATFTKVLLSADFSEGDPDVLSLSGEVYGTITYTGVT